MKYLAETRRGGVASFDANGDGRIGLFFTNGAASSEDTPSGKRPDKRALRNGDLVL